MTTHELVERVKALPHDKASQQVEKYVLELLRSSKYSEQLMIRVYRRAVLDELRHRRLQ